MFGSSRLRPKVPANQSIFDREFGEIRIRRVPLARAVRLRVVAGGRLQATAPPRAAVRLVADLLERHRNELRNLIKRAPAARPVYRPEGRIGQRHRLVFAAAEVAKPRMSIRGGVIRITHPHQVAIDTESVQRAAARGVEKALQTEAELYLPGRVTELARAHGIVYRELKFGNPKGRWGSCSSEGVIRLNIALMNMPTALSDYVIVHELCHVLEMSHSRVFWDHVICRMPDARERRKRLKEYSPYI